MALFSTMALFSQKEGAIQGKIMDLEMGNEPLLFAEVDLKDLGHSTRTNFNGNFEILDVAPGTYVLEVRFAGYETLEIPVEVKEGQTARVASGLKAKTISLVDMDVDSKAQTASALNRD